mmetsp:Transcript_22565/g.45846  ORF Transcript_22565/g.45846 Transcript_22565/m.45846 type:complete len:109 (+) Transcript_22565:887-1213(+)
MTCRTSHTTPMKGPIIPNKFPTQKADITDSNCGNGAKTKCMIANAKFNKNILISVVTGRGRRFAMMISRNTVRSKLDLLHSPNETEVIASAFSVVFYRSFAPFANGAC